MRSLKTRDLQSESIRKQNAHLEVINSDLVAHKEEISRQNEELARRRSEIEEISKRKTQMLASISHDVRSPIQAITLMAEVIRRAAERSERASEIPALAERLQANAIAVADFLSEIIDVASFETGRMTINKSDFLLGDVLAQQRERLLPFAESKGLDLLIEAGDTSLCLRSDHGKLGRIIGNLLANAIKFTSTGSVRLSWGLAGNGSVFVRLADTGRGIQSEDLESIFGEFTQSERSSQRLDGGGWGLGLAISRRMAQLLGGGIDVQSEPGKGSVFTVSLPPACVLDADNRLRDGLSSL
jgi:signal transduction histidine kinase